MRYPLLTALVVFTSFLSVSKAQNYYTVKFPDDVTLYGCGVSADTVWPQITQYACNFGVGVAIKDQVFYTNGSQGCYKILRKWTLNYWCDYNPNWPSPYYILNPLNSDIGPTVTANYQNHGYLEYTQIIKVIDNVPPVFLNCPADPIVFCDYTGNDPAQYNNGWMDRCEGPVNLQVAVTDLCSKANILLSYRLFLDMDSNGSMETYISSSDANAWPIETSVAGDTLRGKIKFPTGFGLPYGTHKVEWIANDHCAGDALCKYSFTVKDCKAPTVVCMNGLSVNIMQTGMITLWDTDFIQYFYDNCTPENQIKIGIRKAGTGTGFPYDVHSVTFDCTELGTQYVEIWAQDAYGNADYCLTYINVQDNMGSCPPQKVSGLIADEQLKGVEGVLVQLTKTSGGNNQWQTETDANGNYVLEDIPAAGTYQLQASLNDAPKNGVNVLDALLAAAHAYNLLALDSPWKMIAADVDNNQTIDDQDVLQIIQLTINQTSQFANNPSWIFIPKKFQFADPALPLASAFPDNIVFTNTPGNTDFVAVKTGDLNLSAQTQSATGADARGTESEFLDFSTVARNFQPGEVFSLDILSPEISDLAAFQMRLHYQADLLELQSVTPNMLPAEYLRQDNGLLQAAWIFPEALTGISGKNQHENVFTLQFKALQGGNTRDALWMDENSPETVGYDPLLRARPLRLVFRDLPAKPGSGARLLPVTPNPVNNQLTATYFLPDGKAGILRIADLNGRTVWSSPSQDGAGWHRQEIDLSGTETNGLLILQLDAPSGHENQKFIKTRN